MTNPASAAPPGPLFPAPRDDLCLDFANTRYWRGSDPATETLHSALDLLDWSAASGGIDPAMVADLRARWARRPDEAMPVFGWAMAVREAIYGTFAAVAGGDDPDPADLAALNEALRTTPSRSALEWIDDRFAWRVAPLAGVDALLVPVLWAAGDLLAGSRVERVRRCANDRCGWLFLDDSKSANRRWCSMSQCGNRAKAHRHYAKRRQAEG
ncbi:ABATE domain-containing protein [Thalassobaculum sp.]|uniref:CGNR zinc finger domain-containing protein n=1 Tax=Thalassobaculum sp. TaxID=2022740 RepID=UPI0032ECEC38